MRRPHPFAGAVVAVHVIEQPERSLGPVDQREQRVQPLRPSGKQGQPIAVDRQSAGSRRACRLGHAPAVRCPARWQGKASAAAQRDFIDYRDPRPYLAALPTGFADVRGATMARVTVEDCVDKVSNRFDLVLIAAQRARQISGGADLTIDRDRDKNPVVALREIAEETVKPQRSRGGDRLQPAAGPRRRGGRDRRAGVAQRIGRGAPPDRRRAAASDPVGRRLRVSSDSSVSRRLRRRL